MADLTTLETFEAGGRIVHVVEHSEDDPRYLINEVVILDGNPVRVVGVETHAVAHGHPALKRPCGIVVEPFEPPRWHTRGPRHLPALIAEEFGGSRSEARRTIAGGGVQINGEVIREMDYGGPISTLQVGKRRFKEYPDGCPYPDAQG